jgi:DNA polymerase/3'-5' exonuclease PolX
MSNKRFNELFIQVLGQMAQENAAKGIHFKSRAYKKAQESIKNFNDNIIKLEDIEHLPGIGKSILEKLEKTMIEAEKTGINTLQEDPAIILAQVYGIGPKKAAELVEQGITSIKKLRAVQFEVLNDKQIIGLTYYEDVLMRIPRMEINEYEKIINNALIHVLSSNKFEQEDAELEIVGSYRRGSSDSGDIDVIITSKFPQVFILWIDKLIKDNVIFEVLSRGPSKCLVMAKISSSQFVRRVDFLYCPPEEYAFSVLYFTGSKEFNTAMRSRALEYGFTMNEHGFHHMVAGERGIKVKGPKLKKMFNNEKDIFDHLEMVWKEPHERKHASDVISV